MINFELHKFSDIAQHITKKVNPSETDLEYYVGLEHLDPESLNIKRWGIPSDVKGEKIFVSKGDLIFGKRRAYQRKVAIADFDCICSAHAMVLKPNEDTIIQDLFPFFLQSDQFMERAVQISVGGLSPTINWRDLARQEFSLPPISEQKRIAKILWAAEDVIVKNETFLAEVEHYKQLTMRDLFSKGIGHTEFKEDKKIGIVPVGWRIGNLGQYIHRPEYGITASAVKQPLGPKFLRITDISEKGVDWNKVPYCNISNGDEEKYHLKIGDILVARIGATTGKSYLIKEDISAVFASYLIRIQCKDIILPKYLGHFTQSRYYWHYIDKVKTGQLKGGVNIPIICSIPILLPPLPEQKQIAAILTQIDETIAAARETIKSTKALKMKLIDELLSPG